MNLRKNDELLPWVIATSLDNPYDRIVIPCLKESNVFNMGVGYFESDWVDLSKDGLVQFVKNDGKMKLLTSIQLGEEEYKAFQLGEKAKTDEILKEELIDKVIKEEKASGKGWTLNYLAWMISQNILDIRILVHSSSRIHMYHDKLSFWQDDAGNSVCFQGSLNSTRNGLSNEEVMALYASWRPGGSEFIRQLDGVWEHDWSGKANNYFIMELPGIVRAEFIRISNPSNPYDSNQGFIYSTFESKKPPKTEDRKYQKDAIAALKENNYHGILAMATGTGKTFTSLLAAKQCIEENGNALVLVVIPQTTLMKQWQDSINTVFDFPKTIVCAFDRFKWLSKFIVAAQMMGMVDPLFAITTYDSLTDATFQSALNNKKIKVIYLFDECHKLGIPQIIRDFRPAPGSYRIGLSATPERWFDENGTNYVKETIGKSVYEYSMEEAIRNHKLCEYNYHIKLSSLDDEEMNDFLAMSSKISKSSPSDNGELSEASKILLERRAKICKKAKSKWDDFFEIFSQMNNKSGTIVYVFDEQVSDMVEGIKKRFSLNVHGIVANTPNEEREAILKGFNEHTIDVLVAIQCLDEGVDVPNCKNEFILASSTNPREFIQRRGRVLRKSKEDTDKVAEIFDFVTIGTDSAFYTKDQELSVIKRELPRVAEFIRLSKNKDDQELIEYLRKIDGISEYVKTEPWNIRTDERNEED